MNGVHAMYASAFVNSETEIRIHSVKNSDTVVLELGDDPRVALYFNDLADLRRLQDAIKARLSGAES